jgi:hypothetical protein
LPLVRRALKILADREVSPQTGLLKSTLLQLDSTFSERNYGASSFLDFVEKLAKAGLVQLKHAGRSVMVELNEGFEDEAAEGDGKGRPQAEVESPRAVAAPEPAPPTASTADGVRQAAEILRNATGARWPMYLRNVKQIFRQAGGFDERRFGFTGLMDLLRALQRDGIVRLERDRRGGLRVFQGSALQRAGTGVVPADVIAIDTGVVADVTYEPESDAASGIDVDTIEVQPGEVTVVQEVVEPEEPEMTPIPVDTTAELLGRAKPKRQTRGGHARAKKPAAGTRKTTARRAARPKKAAAEAADSGDT